MVMNLNCYNVSNSNYGIKMLFSTLLLFHLFGQHVWNGFSLRFQGGLKSYLRVLLQPGRFLIK